MRSKLDAYGEGFLRVLMRRQSVLSCRVAGVLVLFFVAVPLADRYLPQVMATRLLGLPVSWWTVGVVVFPLLVVLAGVYVRRSYDVEDEAIGVVDVATLPDHRQAPRLEHETR